MLLLSLFTFFQIGFAQTSVQLNTQQVSYPITGKHILFLSDSTNRLTIHDITQPAYQSDFQDYKQENINFGFTTTPHWVKIKVENQTPNHNWFLVLNFQQLDHADLYYQDVDGNWQCERSGDLSR